MRMRKTPVATAFRARGLATAMAVLGLLLALARGVSGLSWGSASSGTTEHLQDVAFANGIFVAVGHNGTILTSANGTAWSPQASGTTVVLNGAASSNGVPGTAAWVGVGHAGTILYSTASSASTWSQVPAGSLPPGLGGTILEQVTFGGPSGGQQYVAVGWGGTVLTSPNGTNWTQQTSGTAVNLADVEYGGGQYVIAGWNGTILTSANGTGWTPRSSGTTANLYDLAYGAGTWVAVGSQGTILHSSNGVNWSPASAGTSNDLYDVIYDGCRFVAAGAGGTILTSPDGVNWTPDTSGTAASLYGLASGSGIDIAVGYTGGTVLVAKAPCQAGTPDLAIAKKLLGAAVSGQPVKYLVSVTNVGTAAMPGPITVTDTLGTGLTYVSATGTGWTCSASGQTVTCTHPGPVPAGGSLPAITVTAQSDGTTEGVTNCATVKGAKDAVDVPLDQNGANDRFCVDTPLQQPAPKPDLTISKKPTGPVTAGQPVSYQIVVSNVGAAQAPGPILVTDTLGAGLTYVSASGSGWTCTPSAGPVNGPATVTCTHPGPVPAGGSLPPITVTVNVAADAKEVKNCAAVKAVEQPASGITPEVVLPDANPANNQACDVSQVGPGPEKPGMICGVKFLDHNGDGKQDPGEPGLPNWTIEVKDAAGNVVKAVTGKKGRFCVEVKPGTYTVSEVAQPGWVQTAPAPVPPGTATVTVAAGQTATVAFGNRPEKQPCCLSFTLQGGKADQFSTKDGATAEPASPPPGKPASYFDQTATDQAFWHRFALPAGNCVREAKLEVFVKPLGGQDYNDRIYLYSGSGSWVANFGSNSGNSGGANLLPNQWTVANYPGGQLFTLDLAALPLPGGGTTSLLAALDQNRVLDLAVQDDSSVDFARLTVRFCQCAQGEPEAVAAEAKGGASEVRLVIGKPQLTADGMDREIDVPPVVRGGRTFLPVRALAEALGLDVAWDPVEQRVTLSIEDPPTRIELWVGRPQAKLTKADAARQAPIDPANPAVAPFIEKGRVMLPLRFIAEALGLDVSFDPPTQSIKVQLKSNGQRCPCI